MAVYMGSQAGVPMRELPPNAFWGDDGNLYHKIERTSEGGSVSLQTRRLALTLDEARDKKLDFYHPTLGLIWNGTKLASDRSPESIMRDTSVGGQIPAGELPPTEFQS